MSGPPTGSGVVGPAPGSGRCVGCGAGFHGNPLAPSWVCSHCGRTNLNAGVWAASGLVPPAPPPIVQPAGPFVVEHDRPCARCGYNLRGLTAEGVCPECGAQVARSLKGNLLEFASPEYLRSLYRGATLVIAGSIAKIVLGIFVTIVLVAVQGISQAAAGGGIGGRWTEVVPKMVEVFTAGVIACGWWLFSAPDPAMVGGDEGATARKWVRWLIVAEFAFSIGQLMVELIPGASAAVRSIVSPAGGLNLNLTGVMIAALLVAGGALLADVGRIIATVAYVRTLAPRVPDGRLAADAKRNLWLLPVLSTVGVIACGIGPLVSLVLYLVMMSKCRSRLREILARAEALPDA